MDTRQQSSEAEPADQDAMKAYVDGQLATIKAHMPMTYKAIKDKAGEIGSKAYSFVRLGVAGKPNTFYAIEAGRAVGTPFVNVVGAEQLADYIRQFGCTFLILWAAEAQQDGAKGGADGTH
jgi:hypothetical protein